MKWKSNRSTDLCRGEAAHPTLLLRNYAKELHLEFIADKSSDFTFHLTFNSFQLMWLQIIIRLHLLQTLNKYLVDYHQFYLDFYNLYKIILD